MVWERVSSTPGVWLEVRESNGLDWHPRYKYLLFKDPAHPVVLAASGMHGYATPEDAMTAADAALQHVID